MSTSKTEGTAPAKPIWMVAGVPFERGQDAPTFGPFETREAAERFATGPYERYVYDAVANRASPCGPWYP